MSPLRARRAQRDPLRHLDWGIAGFIALAGLGAALPAPGLGGLLALPLAVLLGIALVGSVAGLLR